MPQSSFPMMRAIALSLWLGGLGLLIMIATAPTGGAFIYALDDPYIHLAIAETILDGGFGVNPGDYAAASSSMIYPYLLAGFMLVGISDMAPLIINIAAMGAALWLAMRFVAKDVLDGIPAAAPFAFGLFVVLPFLFGGFHLPLAGMEHSAHILTIVMALVGLVRTHMNNKPHTLLIAAIILMPLLRFEGVAYAGALIVGLIFWRHYLAALGCAIVLVGAFGLYSQFMISHGLPVLPSSVMSKSDLASGSGGVVTTIAYNLRDAFLDRQGAFLFLGIAGLIGAVPVTLRQLVNRPFTTLQNSLPLMIILTSGAALSAHILAGAFGWFGRYELYAFVLGWLSLLYLYREFLRNMAVDGMGLAQIALFIAMLVTAGNYINLIRLAAKAGPTIYDQQVLMHRFITDIHPVPVAVNDLGRVAYQNDNYVLDLWGLGSEPVRVARANGTFDVDFVDQLAQQHDVQFAMIYAQYFEGAIPAHWHKVATLTRTTMISEVGQTVSFYTTVPTPDIKDKLTRFQASLPNRVTLEILD